MALLPHNVPGKQPVNGKPMAHPSRADAPLQDVLFAKVNLEPVPNWHLAAFAASRNKGIFVTLLSFPYGSNVV